VRPTVKTRERERREKGGEVTLGFNLLIAIPRNIIAIV